MTLIEMLRVRFDPVSNRETSKVVYLTKVPWAPDAYLHVVHKPLPASSSTAVAQLLHFPPSLVRHFDDCNGGTMFSANLFCPGVYLFGCWETGQVVNRGPGDRAPINIQAANEEIRSDLLAFGSYAADGSYLLIDRQSEEVRCSVAKNVSEIRCTWPSIEVWRDHEVARLSALFDRKGNCLVECDDLLPPGDHGTMLQ